MEETSFVLKCRCKHRHSQFDVYQICNEMVVKGSTYCVKHTKLKEVSKNDLIDFSSILPPEVVGVIIEYSRASNVLRAVNSKFRKIIKHLNIIDQSGWYGAVQQQSYSLTIFLMTRRAPIELYIALGSKNEGLLRYRNENETHFAYWEISTSNFNTKRRAPNRDFRSSFSKTMIFYFAKRKLKNIKEGKKNYSYARLFFNKLINFCNRNLNFDLVDRMIQYHFKVTGDTMIELIDGFVDSILYSTIYMDVLEFLYKTQKNFKDDDEKLDFTKILIKRLERYRKKEKILNYLSKCDPNLFELATNMDREAFNDDHIEDLD